METPGKYKILVKFPTRGRPEKFFSGLDNIIQHFIDVDNYMVLCSIDEDDAQMINEPVFNRIREYQLKINLKVVIGESESKIHAVNRDINDEEWPWDILVIFSDDMKFTKKGVDDLIRQQFAGSFPHLDGCIHLNDGYTGRAICTMSILGYVFYQRFGYVYYPGYKSFKCDDEFTIIAYRMDRMAYVGDVWFLHEHPANTGRKEDSDDLYKLNDKDWKPDHDLFAKREKTGFRNDIQVS